MLVITNRSEVIPNPSVGFFDTCDWCLSIWPHNFVGHNEYVVFERGKGVFVISHIG